MADILLIADFDGRGFVAKITVPLEWIPYNVGDSATLDAIPTYIKQIQIGNDRQQFLQFIPQPEEVDESELLDPED